MISLIYCQGVCQKNVSPFAKSCHIGPNQNIHVRKLTGIIFYSATGLVNRSIGPKIKLPKYGHII